MSGTVAGADGCRGGWLCVIRRADPPFEAQLFLTNALVDILNHPAAPKVIAIDIPIGFPERIAGAGRKCDSAARKGLGKRACTVFSAPARAVLEKADYPAACAAASASSDPPRKISQQMFHILKKICEVDAIMTPALQVRIYECHPEVSFWAMNVRVPLVEPKKKREGLDERRRLLAAQGYSKDFLSRPLRGVNAGADDLLDACACAWTAARILKGEAIRFPDAPPLDAKGLRMEILA
jgi:predicted RNase H-like nuclease